MKRVLNQIFLLLNLSYIQVRSRFKAGFNEVKIHHYDNIGFMMVLMVMMMTKLFMMVMVMMLTEMFMVMMMIKVYMMMLMMIVQLGAKAQPVSRAWQV